MRGAKIYSDKEFVPTGWQSKIIQTQAYGGVDPLNVNLKYDSMMLGGNPGSFSKLEIKAERDYIPDFDETKKLNLPILKVLVGHFSLAATFDPSVIGAIDHVDFYCDLKNLTLTDSNNFNDDEVAIYYSLLLLQNGVIYTTVPNLCLKAVHKSRWTGYTLNDLRDDHFVPIYVDSQNVSPNSNHTNSITSPNSTNNNNKLKPNFTEAGDSISFGYLVRASASHSFTSTSGIDSWKVSVIHTHSSKNPNSTDFEEISRRLVIETQERQRMERQLYNQKLENQILLQNSKLNSAASSTFNSPNLAIPTSSSCLTHSNSNNNNNNSNSNHEVFINKTQKKWEQKEEQLQSERKLVEELQLKTILLESESKSFQSHVVSLESELAQLKSLIQDSTNKSQQQQQQLEQFEITKLKDENKTLLLEASNSKSEKLELENILKQEIENSNFKTLEAQNLNSENSKLLKKILKLKIKNDKITTSQELKFHNLKLEIEEERKIKKKLEADLNLEKILRAKMESEFETEQMEKTDREEKNLEIVENLMKESRKLKEETEYLKEMLESEIELKQSAEEALKKLEKIFYEEEEEQEDD